MRDDQDKLKLYGQVFRQITASVNQLSVEDRQKLRHQLGEYAHDLKHLMGLVLGANTVMQRDEDIASKHGDMLDIILQATEDINEYIELLVQYLANQISLEE